MQGNIKKGKFGETVVQVVDSERKQKTNDERVRLGKLIVVYFDVAYYLGLSPFRIKGMEIEKGEFEIRTWWLPKVTWILVLIPCLVFRIAESRDILRDFESDSSWNPTAYFRIFHAFTKILFHATLWFYFAFRSNRYLSIVNYLITCPNLPVPNSNVKFWKVFGPFVCILYICLGTFLGSTHVGRFVDCGNINDSFKDKIGLIFRYCLKWGKFVLFLDNERVNCVNGGLNDNSNFKFSEGFLSIITMMTAFLRQLSGFYEELHLFLGILVFWICAREFANRLDILFPCDLNWNTSLTWYSAIKELSFLVKMAYGNILLYRLALMVFDVPISFDFRSDKMTLWRCSVFLLTNTLSYILAADAAKQVKTFENWISKMIEYNPLSSSISHKQLSVVLYELQTNAVGISASEGFTITYSFVANVSGVILTYFIICVQNSSSNNTLNKN